MVVSLMIVAGGTEVDALGDPPAGAGVTVAAAVEDVLLVTAEEVDVEEDDEEVAELLLDTEVDVVAVA